MNYDAPLRRLDGGEANLRDYAGQVLLIVNVASLCGQTPQYAVLEELHRRYRDRGFSVLGFPCNQFGEQEPGEAEEIAEFCSATYDVTFPMFEKVDVNGPGRHPVYVELTKSTDAAGVNGDVKWNFEKFVIGRDGSTLARVRSKVSPDDPSVVGVIESALL